MKKFRVKEDCFCERYLHEMVNHPRSGLVKMKLQKDDIVELVKELNNLYGSYLRVKKDGKYYDILHKNLEEVR